jgi:hypothetical protein
MRKAVATFVICLVDHFCSAKDKPTISADHVNAALAQIDPYIRSSLQKTKVPGV